jgi:pyridoxamine 5'-phosphate oxidase
MASANPITEFLNALERAKAHQVDTAPVALGTADGQGRPSVRMVLLRGVDERGFVFHTNYTSRKGRELDENPHAALCFYWPTLDEQIRIEGPVRRLPADESSWAPGLRLRARSSPTANSSNRSTGLPSNGLLDKPSPAPPSGAASVSSLDA